MSDRKNNGMLEFASDAFGEVLGWIIYGVARGVIWLLQGIGH